MAKRIHITMEECVKCNNGLKDELRSIKVALLGEDMRSGLVQQTNELTQTLKALTKDREEEKSEIEKRKERLQRWKLAAFTVAAGLIGILLGHLLDLI